MKIGVYLAGYSSKLGGSARFESEVTTALAANSGSSHDFFLVNHSADKTVDLKHIQLPPLAPVTRSRLLLERLNLTTSQSKVFKDSLGQHEIDLLFSPHPSTICDELPFVVTCWDLQHRMQPFFPEVSTTGWTWQNRENHYCNTLRRAAAVITGTEQGKAEVERFYGVANERIAVIPFAVPEALITTEAVRPSWAPGQPFVIYPAQFWPHKNHITILRAMRRLKDDFGTYIQAVFPGSSSLDRYCTLNYIRSTAEALDVDVLYPGFVTDAEMRWLYSNAVSLVFASLFGPDNLPPIEAMRLACPVIASAVPGASEQLGEAAILVAPTNEQEMAIAIQRLLSSPTERQKYIDRGVARVENLNMNQYVESLLKVFDQIASFRRCWPSGLDA